MAQITGTYLDKLKRLPPNDQVTAAKRDLSIERGKARAPRELHIPAPHESLERELDRQITKLRNYDVEAVLSDITPEAAAHIQDQLGGWMATARVLSAALRQHLPVVEDA